MKAIVWERLEELRQLDPDDGGAFVHSLVELYREQSLAAVARLRQEVRAQNTAEIHHIVHGLKSTSANIGAMGLSQFCMNLETITNPGLECDYDLIEVTTNEVVEEFEKVLKELANFK